MSQSFSKSQLIMGTTSLHPTWLFQHVCSWQKEQNILAPARRTVRGRANVAFSPARSTCLLASRRHPMSQGFDSNCVGVYLYIYIRWGRENVLNHSEAGAVPCLCEVASNSCEILQMKQVTAADQQIHDVSWTLVAVPFFSVWSIHTRSSKVPAGIGVLCTTRIPGALRSAAAKAEKIVKNLRWNRNQVKDLHPLTFNLLRLHGRGSLDLFSSMLLQTQTPRWMSMYS